MLKRDFFIPHDKLRGTRLEWLITDDTPIESTFFENGLLFNNTKKMLKYGFPTPIRI